MIPQIIIVKCVSLVLKMLLLLILAVHLYFIILRSTNQFFLFTGDFFTAADHFEAYYDLSANNKNWTTADGISFHTDACINLSRIYTTIGDRMEQESMETNLEYLTKAYEKAKEGKESLICITCDYDLIYFEIMVKSMQPRTCQ